MHAYTIQSIAKSKETSCTGVSIADRTINSRTSAALGTLADEHEAAVLVKLKLNNNKKIH